MEWSSHEAAALLLKAHETQCDPYGEPEGTIGNAEDCYYFGDASLDASGLHIVMAVLDSETMHSLESVGCYLCTKDTVLEAAQHLVEMARNDVVEADLPDVEDTADIWLETLRQSFGSTLADPEADESPEYATQARR